jgi:hypothetical protein
MDLLPYKVGTNIAEEMEVARTKQSSEEVVLVYRNTRTGRVREFSINDKAWHNDKRWEWVETRVESDEDGVEPMILEFYISNQEGEKTAELLAMEEKLYMLCVMDFERVTDKIKERFAAVERYAEQNGGRAIYLTPEHLPANAPVLLYNIDAKTMKTMLRADYGLVELERGVITGKYNYRDIPY